MSIWGHRRSSDSDTDQNPLLGDQPKTYLKQGSSSRSRGIGYTILLVFFIAFVTLQTKMTDKSDQENGSAEGLFQYTVVKGIFIQSDPEFENEGYDVLNDSFGLIDKTPERWRKFGK